MKTKLFFIAIIWILLLILGGTFGYMIIEKADFLDALFMTVITITTIGYKEYVPLSEKGRIFTIFLALSGTGFIFYIFALVSEFVIRHTVENFWGQRMKKEIKKLKEHCILCGFGRIGRHIYEFIKSEIPVVIIEKDKEIIEELKEKKILCIEGDATCEDVLIEAGIEKAKYLVASLGEDASNLYVTLTARNLNPELYILSRADNPQVEKKLYQAGATKVVTPHLIGARKMALSLLKPNVVDFMEIASHSFHLDLQIEEIKILSNSSLAGKTIIESKIRDKTKAIILAIKRADGTMLFNPLPDTVINSNDILIALGEKDGLEILDKLAKGEIKS
jgi:voltage-gated potassium channel